MLAVCVLAASTAMGISGCANVASAPSQPPGPPPGSQDISVTVTPSSGSVLLGNQLTFTAAVKNASDTSVSWSVNGTPGGTAGLGTITGAGIYTAPIDLPVPANLLVTATSHANSSKSGSATVTVRSDIVVTLPTEPPGGVGVELGATRTFIGTLKSSAHPDQAIV
ncbi:MAG: hypothetical protein M3P45_10375 [Acidobacteriota bacterium]|nr:hypothetical protein [Acidobacteriota bacterium]